MQKSNGSFFFQYCNIRLVSINLLYIWLWLCDSKKSRSIPLDSEKENAIVERTTAIMREIKERSKYQILKILQYWTKEQFDGKLNIVFRILDPPILFSPALFQLVNLYVN